MLFRVEGFGLRLGTLLDQDYIRSLSVGVEVWGSGLSNLSVPHVLTLCAVARLLYAGLSNWESDYHLQ